MCMICARMTPDDPLAGFDTHLAGSGSSAPPEALGDRVWIGLGLVRETADAAETTATTYSVLVGQSAEGRISDSLDEDWFAVQLVAGQTYDIRILGNGAEFLTNPYVRLYDSTGTQIAFDDDSFSSGSNTHERDSRLFYTATTTGTYYVAADAFQTETGEYLLTVADYDSAGMVFTADEIAWQLTNNGEAFFSSPEAAAFDVGDGILTVNITGLTAEGQYLARQALLAWTQVTGIVFQEATGAAEITFDDNQSGAFANTMISGTTITGSTVNVGLDWLTNFGTSLDSYSFETYVHEVGHALGLAHGGNYNGSATFGIDNFYQNDSLAWSIMSYMQAENDEFDSGGASDWNTFVDASFRYLVTPQIADIIAIQRLYGTFAGLEPGNTTYGFNSNTGNAAIDTAVNSGALMAMTILDGGGLDTLDFSGTSARQYIILDDESMSSVMGGRHNLGIARGTVIENALGGSGADTILGNAVNNAIRGNGGNDSLYGGGGNDVLIGGDGVDQLFGGDGSRDRAQYHDATTGVRADLQTPATNTGYAAGDVYSSIEDLYGSNFADTLMGNTGANMIWGSYGSDVIYGRVGNDTLYGGDSNDVMLGGAGADVLDGGNGTRDRAQYTDSTTGGVRADLQSPAGNMGWAAGDTYVGIEDLQGSTFSDVLYGNSGANIIWGDNGNDQINGRAGADTIYGGSGNDSINGASGAVRIDGGTGTRDRVQYHDATAGLRADLLTQSTNTGWAAGDTYVGVEDLFGSVHADTLMGNGGGNMIWGNNGNDVLFGRDGNDSLYGGEGNDVLFGGTGADVLDGGNGLRDRAQYTDVTTGGVRADLQVPTTNEGAADGDTYVGIEDLHGSTFSDALFGNTGANIIWGDNGNDILSGRLGNDTLYGGDGDDTISGNEGNDALTGGAGFDTFVFDRALGGGNVDRITDFSAAFDTISLENAIFTALATGGLSAAAFTNGGAATTAAHRIVYNQATGQLYYDANGNAAGGQVLFATVLPGTALTNVDFLIV